MRLRVTDLLEATSGSISGGSQVAGAITSYHTDSREVKPGGVFFALKGAESDGHLFIADAARNGAALAVVERLQPPIPGLAQVVVDDSWRALYDLAAHVLRQSAPLVLGVPGSNG